VFVPSKKASNLAISNVTIADLRGKPLRYLSYR
jgi:hypothetical protein